MKSIHLAFLSILSLSACKSSEQMLSTKWNITDVTFKGDIPEKDRESARKEFMAQKTVTFKPDHTVQLGEQEARAWKLSAKGDTITMTENDKESVIIVRKLNGKNAQLESGDSKRSYTIFLSASE